MLSLKQLQMLGDLQFKKGTLYNVYVRHDDDCAHWDSGQCSCKADITIEEAT